MNHPKIFFRVHAVQRMFERKVSVKNISQVLQAGETIEDYSSEMPGPGRLILGFCGRRPFHVVAAGHPDEITIITVYNPDPEKWNRDFKRRKV